MRRHRSLETPGLAQDAGGRDPAKSRDRLAIALSFEAGLDGFPIASAKRIGERSVEHRLPDARVGAGDDEADAHGVSCASASANRSSMPATVGGSTLRVRAMRKRAVPVGTVGGRIARISK